jgi:phthalate 4,5-dioxygenase reductase subunit
MLAIGRIGLRVHARRALTDDVHEFDLRALDGTELSRITAGGSLIVQTPSGELRNYSICNDDTERHRYVIAVKREAVSRGGSQSMHEAAIEGTALSVEVARTGLWLAKGHRHLLLAGGIGITTMLSLARRLSRGQDGDFHLIYLARSRREAAYADVVLGPAFGGRSTCHFSTEHDGRRFDLGPWLEDNSDGSHLYYCGPTGMMDAVRLGSIHWPRSRVHAEQFRKDEVGALDNEPFEVRQAATGRVFQVREDQTILDALRAMGMKPAASCESGTCGRCLMPLISGKVDHRDVYLDGEGRASSILPCVSRGSGGVIELDF